ncbi:MAG: hypothetical protein FWG44_06335 [Oscillospiraceae bacterium]|nr:hypothetical protein [Oscillospiraceae bacterium]
MKNYFSGKVVSFTGKLQLIDRAKQQEFLASKGGKIALSLVPEINLVVTGPVAVNAKIIEFAEKNNIEIIDEAAYLALVDKVNSIVEDDIDEKEQLYNSLRAKRAAAESEEIVSSSEAEEDDDDEDDNSPYSDNEEFLSDKYTDKSGLFEDFNFKLVVMDRLLDQESSFADALEELMQSEEYISQGEEYMQPIPVILDFISELKFEQADLDKITSLTFDGGNEIYFSIIPDWDGEEYLFDIRSVKGFEHLKNLKDVCYISMCKEKILEPIYEYIKK